MTAFSRSFVLIFAGVIALACVLSVLVDPRVAFDTTRIDGVNKYKLAAQRFTRTIKPYRVALGEHDVLITGSSKAARGFDCQFFIDRGQSCYNAGLGGGSLYEAFRFLQQRPESIKLAVVSLEFFPFMSEQMKQREFEENRLLWDSVGELNLMFGKQFIEDYFSHLLAWPSLRLAYSTWNLQDRPFINVRADGMMFFDKYGSWGFDPATLSSGDINERVNKQVARNKNVMGVMKKHFYTTSQDAQQYKRSINRHLQVYKKMLDLAYRNDMPMALVLTPSHIDYWMIIRQLKLYGDYENWKRKLVRLNELTAEKYERTPYPIYDYSGVNQLSISDFPKRNRPDTFSHDFFDVMHFSNLVGDLMLERVVGQCDDMPEDMFGVCLTPLNMNRHMRKQRQLFDEYVSSSAAHLKNLFPRARSAQ